MRVVIVGGGKLGHQIARNMLEKKYNVKLIEKDKLKCVRLANELDAEVICGDGHRNRSARKCRNKECGVLHCGYG